MPSVSGCAAYLPAATGSEPTLANYFLGVARNAQRASFGNVLKTQSVGTAIAFNLGVCTVNDQAVNVPATSSGTLPSGNTRMTIPFHLSKLVFLSFQTLQALSTICTAANKATLLNNGYKYIGFADGAGVAIAQSIQWNQGSINCACTETLTEVATHLMYKLYIDEEVRVDVMEAAGFDVNGQQASENLIDINTVTTSVSNGSTYSLPQNFAGNRIFNAVLPWWFLRDGSLYNRVASNRVDLYLNFQVRSMADMLVVSKDRTRQNQTKLLTGLGAPNDTTISGNGTLNLLAMGASVDPAAVPRLAMKSRVQSTVCRVSQFTPKNDQQVTFAVNNSVGVCAFLTTVRKNADLSRGIYFQYNYDQTYYQNQFYNNNIDLTQYNLNLGGGSTENNANTLNSYEPSGIHSAILASVANHGVNRMYARPFESGPAALSYCMDLQSNPLTFQGVALVAAFGQVNIGVSLNPLFKQDLITDVIGDHTQVELNVWANSGAGTSGNVFA